MSSAPVPAPLLCLTCSASLTAPSLPSHSNSEKPEPAPLLLPCGLHSICGRCQTRRRRLAQNCILCDNILESAQANGKRSDRSLATRSRGSGAVANPSLPPSYEETGDFVIGDEDDQDDSAACSSFEKGERADGESCPPYDVSEADDARPDEKSGGSSVQLQVHYLKPEETLLGLSMKYDESGEVLCRLNKLPISTLSTTPHLLHTLPFLLLPPSAASVSTEPLHAPFEERRRLILRRFQVRTRCSDWAMANAYVSQVFRERDAELAMVKANRSARGQDVEGLLPREGDELEEAELAWEKDQQWEQAQKGKGKMGSKMRSTGQVEREVKGWGWR